jgi:two-component system sensor histidine kinase/response regulator
MKTSGRLLLNLINNILDVSRIEAGKTLLRNDPLSLRSCLQAAANVISYELNAKNLTLETFFDEKLPVVVKGDETRLKQILVNLLHNAVKFTEHGTITVRMERLEKNRIQFSVSDTGIGMTPTQVKHVFEPFYQAAPTAQRYKGTGLGLAISKQLIELMNGDISAQSVSGKGTTVSFRLELPILEDSPEYTAQQIKNGFAPAAQISPELLPSQIVFLPGNDLDDKVIQNYLYSRGYNHDTVPNWERLLEKLTSEQIRLAVLNLSETDENRDFLVKVARQAIPALPDKYWLIYTTKSSGEILDADHPTERVLLLPKPLDFEQTLIFLQTVFKQTDSDPAEPKSGQELEQF